MRNWYIYNPTLINSKSIPASACLLDMHEFEQITYEYKNGSRRTARSYWMLTMKAGDPNSNSPRFAENIKRVCDILWEVKDGVVNLNAMGSHAKMSVLVNEASKVSRNTRASMGKMFWP